MFTRARVVKEHDVKIARPLVLDKTIEEFQRLYESVAVVSAELAAADSLQEISATGEGRELSAELRAEQVLAVARKQAREILAQAEVEAEAVKQAALQEVAVWREEVAQKVRSEVVPLAEAEAKKLLAEAKGLLNLARQALATEYAKVDEELLGLATQIAERIVRASLAIKPQRLLQVVNSILLIPPERDDLRLRLSPADVAWITQLNEENLLPCPWIKDDTLRQGEVYLEHRHGIIDARIQTQLKVLEEFLREELAGEQVEKAGGESLAG